MGKGMRPYFRIAHAFLDSIVPRLGLYEHENKYIDMP